MMVYVMGGGGGDSEHEGLVGITLGRGGRPPFREPTIQGLSWRRLSSESTILA